MSIETRSDLRTLIDQMSEAEVAEVLAYARKLVS